MSVDSRRLVSLLGANVRRGFVVGRIYVGLGIAISSILAIVLVEKKIDLFAVTYPLELPLFGSLGSMGGIMLFSSDRQKGVFEYLLAYDVQPWMLFLNGIVTTALLATAVLAGGLLVSLGAFVAAGGVVTSDLQSSILFYSIPMAYASALFATVCAMIWSSLATPRTGINSPAGLAPIFGVAPPILVLYAAESFAKAGSKTDYYNITAGASVAFLVVAIAMIAFASRRMSPERYLSPV